MATAKKRRPTSRSRSKKATLPTSRSKPKGKGSKAKVEARTWIDEVFAVALFAGALFLLISFLSLQYRQNVGSALIGSGSPDGNIMGPVGHVVATVLAGFFGWCALVPVLWSGWLGRYLWSTDEVKPERAGTFGLGMIVGVFGIFLFSATIAAVFWSVEGGGSFGVALATPLMRFFNASGASLIAAAFLLISIAFASKQSVAAVLLGVGRMLREVLWVSLFLVPLYCIRTVHVVLLLLFGMARFAFNSLLSPLWEWTVSSEEVEEEPELPKPRRRKNRAPAPVKEEPDSDVRIVVARNVKEIQARAKKNAAQKKKPKKAPELIGSEQFAKYRRPKIELLTKGEEQTNVENEDDLREKSRVIEGKLRDFNIQGRVTLVHPGPVITLFEFEPAPGVKVGKIAALQDDLAMSLRATSIRIIAPIPKKGTVGIEVPNRNREVVRLRDVLESDQFANDESLLTVAMGKDTYGNSVVSDIASMPHLLMAGATGTGKSVCINAVLLSLLYRANPAELGLILIDPKILELSVYEGVPHLRVPVVTEPRKAKAVLQWAVNEMEKRYRLMQSFGVRSVDGYNRIALGENGDGEGVSELRTNGPDIVEDDAAPTVEAESGEEGQEQGREPTKRIVEQMQPLPKIVIVIDELADLMLTVGREIEDLITRLAQKARAAGIHLIVATQRPSVDVITGLIKANFPARLSFRVSSRIDSRTILDTMGAEKLLGRGDMLFQRPGAVHLQRVHGAFVSDNEVKRVVSNLKKDCQPAYDAKIIEMCEKALEEDGNALPRGDEEEEYDSFYDKAVQLVLEKGQASTSMLQRAFRIGYNRAARIIDTMEREGIVGPMDGSKPRQVIVGGAAEE